MAREAAPLLKNTTDQPVRVSVLPEHGTGWMGAPGLQGHRSGGRSWSPVFTAVEYEAVECKMMQDGAGQGGDAGHGGGRLSLKSLMTTPAWAFTLTLN